MKKSSSHKKEKYVPKAQRELKEAVHNFNWRLAGGLAVGTLACAVVYFFLVGFPFWKWVVGAYVAAASVLIIAYFIVNRAFTGRGVTYEMLPDTMSDAEKREYLDDVADRERRSRWMLMVIFPIVVTLLIDLCRLFFLDDLITKLH